MKHGKIFTLIFFTILIIDILFSNIEWLREFRMFSKPSIMVSLLVYFYLNSKYINQQERWFILASLALLLLGDIALLNFYSSLWFTLGFVCVMLANVTYSLAFRNKVIYNIDRLIPFWVIILLYCIVIIYYMYDNLGDMLIPMVIFMLIALNMTQTVFLRYGVVSKRSFYMVFIGAIFFIASESIAGLSKFYRPLWLENVTNIGFYAIGQFLIVKGVLANYCTVPLKKTDPSIQVTR